MSSKNPKVTSISPHGEESFEFSILEFADAANLLRAEQKWINTTQSAGCRRFAGTKHVRVWEGFIDPGGNEVTITNLYEFCRQRGLDFPSMHRLAKGKSKLKPYKGWIHKNSPRQRDYMKTYNGFLAPDGRLVGPITNLAASILMENQKSSLTFGRSAAKEGFVWFICMN